MQSMLNVCGGVFAWSVHALHSVRFTKPVWNCRTFYFVENLKTSASPSVVLVASTLMCPLFRRLRHGLANNTDKLCARVCKCVFLAIGSSVQKKHGRTCRACLCHKSGARLVRVRLAEFVIYTHLCHRYRWSKYARNVQ